MSRRFWDKVEGEDGGLDIKPFNTARVRIRIMIRQ